MGFLVSISLSAVLWTNTTTCTIQEFLGIQNHTTPFKNGFKLTSGISLLGFFLSFMGYQSRPADPRSQFTLVGEGFNAVDWIQQMHYRALNACRISFKSLDKSSHPSYFFLSWSSLTGTDPCRDVVFSWKHTEFCVVWSQVPELYTAQSKT